MLIPLAGRLIFVRFDRVDAWRNDDASIGAVADDRAVGGLSIIGAIGGEPSDWTVDLIEKWAHVRGTPVSWSVIA